MPMMWTMGLNHSTFAKLCGSASNGMKTQDSRNSGRVAMDQFVVDLGPDAADAPGDAVELFGPASGIPVEEWAAAAGTINYELVTRIGGRVDRQHVDPTPTQEARP